MEARRLQYEASQNGTNEQYQAATQLVNDTQVEIGIRTVMEDSPTQSQIDEILALDDTEIEAKFNLSGEEQIAQFRAGLEELSSEAPDITVKIDEEQFNQLLNVDNSAAKDSIDEAVEYAEGQDPEIKVGANTNSARGNVDALVTYVNVQSPKIKIGADTEQLVSNISNALASRTFNVNVNAHVAGVTGSVSTKTNTIVGTNPGGHMREDFAGTVLPGHADGTTGNGSIVRNGVWRMLGDHESPRRHDVVFNEHDTERLQRTGRLSGFGGSVAHANGTDVTLKHDEVALVNELG